LAVGKRRLANAGRLFLLVPSHRLKRVLQRAAEAARSLRLKSKIQFAALT